MRPCEVAVIDTRESEHDFEMRPFFETFLRYAYDGEGCHELASWIHHLASTVLNSPGAATFAQDAAQSVLLTLTRPGKAQHILRGIAVSHPRLAECLEGGTQPDSLVTDAGRLVQGYVERMVVREWQDVVRAEIRARRVMAPDPAGPPPPDPVDALVEEFAPILKRVQERMLRRSRRSIPPARSFREIVMLSFKRTSVEQLCPPLYDRTPDAVHQQHHRIRERILEEIRIMESESHLSAAQAEHLEGIMRELVRCKRKPGRTARKGGMS